MTHLAAIENISQANYTFQQFQVAASANGTGKSTSMNRNGEISGRRDVGGNKDGNNNGDGSSSHHSKHNSNQDPNTAAIVGGILGSVIFLILAFFGVFLFWRRRRRLARISNVGQNRSPPMMYYAQSIPDGSPRGRLIITLVLSVILTIDNFFSFRTRTIHGWTRLIYRQIRH